MTIQRMEHVGIVVDDLAAATAFFVELGLKLQGHADPRPTRVPQRPQADRRPGSPNRRG